MIDTDYFARRAEEEARLAAKAKHPAAVAAHYQMSTAYLERAYPTASRLRSPATDGR